MEEKIKIIDEICKHHPASGVEKGWSWYVGGMKDSGAWYFRKMLDAPIEELQAFLRQLILDKNRPSLESLMTEEEKADAKKIIQPIPGMYMTLYEYKLLHKWHEELERKIFFGL